MTARFSRRDVLLSGAALAAGPSLLVPGCGTTSGATGEGPPQDPEHPLAGLALFNGDNYDLPDLVGRVTVLDFWASWCAPCRMAFRYLDQLYRTFRADGLQLIAVSVDTDPAAGQRFRARLRPQFPTAWDPAGAVRDRFRVASLPTTVMLDGTARVVHRHEGFDMRSHKVLETHVRRLVRAA